jgi:hypothetical protein
MRDKIILIMTVRGCAKAKSGDIKEILNSLEGGSKQFDAD